MTTWTAIILVLLIAVLLAVSMFGCGFRLGFITQENFENITASTEEEVIRSFQSILQRDPTIEELTKITTDIQQGNSSIHKLQVQMVSSDEYLRMVKTQSNTVTPELLRVIAEREYLAKIGELYQDVFQKKIPGDLVLPLHDLYVYVFKRSDLTMRNLFYDSRYPQFEQDMLSTKELNREDLFDLYNTTFVRRDPRTPVEMPKATYMVPEGSIASDASMWTSMDDSSGALGTTVIPPWKSPDQEEATYSPYEKEDGTPPAPPAEVTRPILPPTTPPSQVSPVDVNAPPPQPNAPLQGSLVGTNLSTSPLTTEPTSSPTVTAMPMIATRQDAAS